MHKRLKRIIYKFFHPQIGEIVMLHRVLFERSPKTDKLNYVLEVSPEYLEQTILKYRDLGYKFVNLDDVYRRLSATQFFSKKIVCFTFDDGFIDNYEIAYPIFKKYNCPFTIYVTSGFVDQKERIWWCNENEAGEKKLAMTIEQLKILSQDKLCTVGSHTVSHPHLAELSAEQQYKEMLESKKRLEEITGTEIVHFSYPHGSYNEESLTMAEKCGYKTATRNFGDIIRKGDNPFILNRRYLFEE